MNNGTTGKAVIPFKDPVSRPLGLKKPENVLGVAPLVYVGKVESKFSFLAKRYCFDPLKRGKKPETSWMTSAF
jgi:hypothetical protein